MWGRERKSLKLKDSELVSLGQGRAGVSRGDVDPLGPPGCRPPPTPTVNCGNVPQALPLPAGLSSAPKGPVTHWETLALVLYFLRTLMWVSHVQPQPSCAVGKLR